MIVIIHIFDNFCGKFIFSNNLINYIVSTAALVAEIYAASAEDSATHVCLFMINWMGFLTRSNKLPVVYSLHVLLPFQFDKI